MARILLALLAFTAASAQESPAAPVSPIREPPEELTGDALVEFTRNEYLEALAKEGIQATRGCWLYGDYRNDIPNVNDPVNCAQACNLDENCYHWNFKFMVKRCDLKAPNGGINQDIGDWITGHASSWRWKLPKGPLPKLVDVRKNGPGDVEAAKRAEKGHKASVSAAMVQAARMQPKRFRTPSKTAAEKPLSQAESRASLTEAKVVHFNQDPVEQSQDYEILSGERSSESPARSSRSGRSSRGGARSMSRPSSAGWSLAESETGPVLSTFPKECKPPSLSARSKRVFSSHG